MNMSHQLFTDLLEPLQSSFTHLNLFLANAAPTSADQEAPGLVSRLWDFGGKLHPLVVHFPIALITVAGIFVALRYVVKDKISEDVVFYSLWIGALSAVVAAAMGWSNADLNGYSDENDIVFDHRWWGTIISALSLISAIVLTVLRKKNIRTVPYHINNAAILFCALVIGFVGHFGGQLTYGETYVDDAIKELIYGPPEKTVVELKYPEDGIIVFATHVQPILETKCISCHGGTKPKGDIELTNAETFKAADTLDPDDLTFSILLEVLETDDEDLLMPPPKEKNPLTPDELKIMKAWILAGAPFPAEVNLIDKSKKSEKESELDKK